MILYIFSWYDKKVHAPMKSPAHAIAAPIAAAIAGLRWPL